MKLKNDWRKILAKSWAVKLAALFGMALPQVWVSIPETQQAELLGLIGLRGAATLISFLAALIIAARLLQQKDLHD
jgi:hypothetical protein